MAAFQNFRGQFNGFNREDVVSYIARMNHEHEAQLNQCANEVKTLRAELEELREQQAADTLLSARLEEALSKNAALEQELEALRLRADRAQTDGELEAYRRAERAERIANERVAQMYAQASGILADATVCTDQTANQVGELTQQVCQQLAQLQETLVAGADAIRGTAAAMYAIKPVSEEQ